MHQSGLSKEQSLRAIRHLYGRLSECTICPRQCGANRKNGERGHCGAGLLPKVAAANIHYGEEPPISGSRGSGTVFFSHCTLHCVFCQNWPISQKGVGEPTTVNDLADRMIRLQKRGAHNINLVNPTHYWPQIAASVYLARRAGLTIPVLANTNGFERVETLELVGDFVQVWLPDLKYTDDNVAADLSYAQGIPEANWQAVCWMAEKHGSLQCDQTGIAQRGVMIRHLALPGNLEETEAVLAKIRKRFSEKMPVSLMSQYFPAYRANERNDINRKLNAKEIRLLKQTIRRLGLSRGWRQLDE